MRYRFATSADLSVLARMNQQLIRDEGHRNRMSLPELEERVRGWIAGEYKAALFEDENGVVGYALYKLEAEGVYLRQFFIQASRRREGLGRAAVNWLIENAWADARRLRIDVLVGNKVGIEFWRAVGFSDYAMTMERDL